jgi:hypothetical protein
MILRGVELLAEGDWPASVPLSVRQRDIDDMVSSFQALNLAGRVPLKLGHEGPDARENPESQFALGWVQRIWREGARLVSDLDVPKMVANAIKEKMLKFVSVELLKNVQAFNRTLPWVLDAVALLGTDQPAVGILKPLQESIAARRSQLRAGGRVTLQRGTSTLQETTVDKEQFDKLQAAVEKLTATVTAQNDTIATLKTANETERTARIAAEAEATKQKVVAARAKIDEIFNAAIKAERIDPKVRNQFLMLTGYDKDDARALALDPKEVETYVTDHSKPGKKVAAARGSDPGTEADEDKVDETKPADEEMSRLVKVAAKREKLDLSKPADIMKANRLVMRSHPTLARAYREQPGVTKEAR